MKNDSQNIVHSLEAKTTVVSNDTGWGLLFSLPISFVGLGLFRGWLSTLNTFNHQWAGGLLHDCVLAVILLALVIGAKTVVPLCSHKTTYVVCGISALAASGLSVANTAFGGDALLPFGLAATALAALASALFILAWCELYSCLDIARICLCLVLSYLVQEIIKLVSSGFAADYRIGLLIVLPLASLFFLARASALLPIELKPRRFYGKIRIPGKLIALISLYYFVAGLGAGIGGSPTDLYTSISSVAISTLLLVAVVFFSDKFDLALIYRSPIVLLVSTLFLLPFAGTITGDVLFLSTALSFEIFSAVIFLLLCDISKNFSIPAVVLFGTSEATVIFRSLGNLAGSSLEEGAIMPNASQTILMLFGLALLIITTLLLFAGRDLSTKWGVTLFGKGKISTDKEEQERYVQRCNYVAKEYRLTPREKEVLVLLGKGQSISQVCKSLSIAKGTAKAHTDHIYQKLGINSRKQLLDMLSGEQN